MKNIDLINKELPKFERDLATLINFESVNYDVLQEAPFSDEIEQCLTGMLDIAAKLGYETYQDLEGYYGYAQIGCGTELFGVLGHLDVVPAGDRNKWYSNPFELDIRDGYYYGRGVADDKGSTLIALYALKLLLDQGYELKQRVRFIFGTDEETLWRCIKQYKLKEEIPLMGFTPDSSFPLIYAEKGLLQVNIKANNNTDLTFSGGEAYNSCPSQAIIKEDPIIINNLNDLNISYKIENDHIIVLGKSVHAQVSDQGDNAITNLVRALAHYKDSSDLIRFILDKGMNPNGTDLFGVIEDDISGKLMFNIGKIVFEPLYQEIKIDMRIPVSYTKEDMLNKLQFVCDEYNLCLEEYDYLDSICVDKDSLLVRSLMSAYQKVTNDYRAQPKATGGATYARSMSNFVAYGAVLATSSKTEHQPNERISINDVKTAMEIYMEAFKLLVTK